MSLVRPTKYIHNPWGFAEMAMCSQWKLMYTVALYMPSKKLYELQKL